MNLLLFPPSGEGRPIPLVSLAFVRHKPLVVLLDLWYYGIEVDCMPAVSKDQQIAMAIAEHSPSKLNAKNKGLLSMSKGKLSEFASTPRKGLPKKVSTKKVGR